MSESMACAKPNLSSGVSTPVKRFFAFLKSLIGNKSARMGRLIGAFGVGAVSFCP